MRARIALGGLAAALALAVSAPASGAAPRPMCLEPGDLLCTVLALTCVLEPEGPCHP